MKNISKAPRKIIYRLASKHTLINPNRRYSKATIKTYLYLISNLNIPTDPAIVQNISLPDLAKDLNFNLKTVKYALGILSYDNIISISHAGDYNHINVMFHEIKEMYMKKNEYPGAEGYVVLTKELINELLSISNVNALRLALYKLQDEERIMKNQNSDFYAERCEYKKLQEVISRCYRFRSQAEKILVNLKNIFSVQLDKKYFTLSAKQLSNLKENAQAVREKVKKELLDSLNTRKMFAEIYNNAGKNVKNNFSKQIEDLTNLAIEFGVNTVLNALKKCHKLYAESDTGVYKSIGAVVRTEIKKANSRIVF